ncbi:MAG: preprotein translocase subunit SecA [Verrucomicrobiota bacterium]
MIQWILKKIVGSRNQRTIKKLWPKVLRINEIEETLQEQPDSVLKEFTKAWQEKFALFHDPQIPIREKLEKWEDAPLKELGQAVATKMEGLREFYPSLSSSVDPAAAKDELIEALLQAKTEFTEASEQFPDTIKDLLGEALPEAFAVVKNAARRLCGQEWKVSDHPVKWEMVHFDVQLLGGMALHEGMITEMQTGEGKTLVATLPTYLNALTGKGVHVVTVNDYLARRDSEWMGYLFKFLGLEVGVIQNQMPPDQRREAYQCDITYGTASEFGFDYLRDNGMAPSKQYQVQREHFFSIIDEVDSILIDEARTPLIISGPSTVGSHQFDRFKPLVDQIVKKQTVFCNGLVTEAKKAAQEEDLGEAGRKLFQVKSGQPRNRGFLRAMEDPLLRSAMEKAELELYQDPQKKQLYGLKEDLFFAMDEKAHDADLTEKGRTFLNPEDPEAFTLPDLADSFAVIDGDAALTAQEKVQKKDELQRKMDFQAERINNISQLLRAYCIYEKDVDYVVEDGKVMIVDPSTGRKMPGRRWSDGLHQAVEAKEGVKIEGETQTFATVTIQNYFRMYEKLAGMTGTAETEASEFHDIYGMDVLVVPTNRPNQRQDENDKIFKTRREKYSAVLGAIKESHSKGQPILVGTASVESSETLGRMLKREKLPHSVLNAKHHRQEAEIVSRAGLKSAITVSTNMAGRGTDIKLGPGVEELGGLRVIATERHESRRVDRQLRGRCARQGDPGASVFFISFEDDLMRNFAAAERMTKMMERFGVDEGEELSHPWLNKSVETAQKRVEQRNYMMRKRVLDFDDVMNQQRTVVYEYRNEVLEAEEPRQLIVEVLEEAVPRKVAEYYQPDLDAESEGEAGADTEALLAWANTTFPLGLKKDDAQLESRDEEGNARYLIDEILKLYQLNVEHKDPELVEDFERRVILEAIDRLWQEHLYNMDALREGVYLRAQGQKDPLVEYKHEAYAIFVDLMDHIKEAALQNLFRGMARLMEIQQMLKLSRQQRSQGGVEAGLNQFRLKGAGQTPEAALASGGGAQAAENEGPKITIPVKRDVPKVGRNEPCPCGSGKKYKQCCGRHA